MHEFNTQPPELMKSKQYSLSRCAGLQARLSLILTLALGFGGLLQLPAQNVPERMNYQGLLLTGAGVPVTAPTAVEFRIWDSPTNTSGLLWGRRFTVVPDANGVFNVVLSGDGALLSGAPDVSLSSVFTGTNGQARYVELTVAGATAIRPRQQFLAAPYAFLAYDVTAARQNFSVTGVLTVSGTANLSSLTVNAAGSLLTPGSVTASNFVGYGTIPIGGIILWSGSVTNVPAGWALCDGTTNNGVVSPDLRGRFVLAAGSGAGLTPRSAGESGGEETHVLTIAEMPAHTHTNVFVDNGYPDNWGRRDSSGVNGHFIVDPHGGGNLANFSSTANGGGGAHTNMPPYYVLAYLIRVQ
jgi:microcystin-dependent protein